MSGIPRLTDSEDEFGTWARWGMSERAIAHLPAGDPPWQHGSLCGRSRGGWHPLTRWSLECRPWFRCRFCLDRARRHRAMAS